MIRVLDSGFFSTIQDTGRFGYRNIGVPVSGTMDRYSAGIANGLLENDEKDAVLEITMTGPELEFEVATYIAITGAKMSPKLNKKPVADFEVHAVKPGDVLSFGKLTGGFRSYLAVKGGFLTEKILGSRSFFKPITKENRLKTGMELSIETESEFSPKITTIKTPSGHTKQNLEVLPGPEFEMLPKNQQEHLFSREYTIAKENNRMAYQLNESLEGHHINMLTSATLPGTVQLTPSGRIIILMYDGQTTGGYPRILQLSQKALTVLSQKKSGDLVSFQLY